MESRDFRYETRPEEARGSLVIRNARLAAAMGANEVSVAPENPLDNPLLESELQVVAKRSTKAVEMIFGIVSPIGSI